MTPDRAAKVIDAWRDIARPPQGPLMSRAEIRPSPGALRDLFQALACSTADPEWCGELIELRGRVPKEARPIARSHIRGLIARLDAEQAVEA